MVALTALDQLAPVLVGCDIGKLQDNTAVAVAEVLQEPTGQVHFRRGEQELARIGSRGEWIPPKGLDPVVRSHYYIRHITRMKLGTSYPDVANHLADMLSNPLFAKRRVRIFLDVTGVGQGVYDLLRVEIKLRKETQHILLLPTSFVHGEKYNRRTGSLGKAYLVSRLQALLQTGRVHGPDTSEMKATLEELRSYEVRIDEKGHDTYGAMSHNTHDDLATALALACLTDPYSEKPTYSERVY